MVDRPGWVRVNADGMARLLTPLVQTLEERRPRPAGRFEQTVGPKATGLQAGGVLAFLSSKVLGQFEFFADPAGQLLLVAPNVVDAERSLGVSPADFRLWVALHEVTHRVQFTAVPWLRGHLTTEIDALVDATDLDPDAVRERLSAFVGQLGSALRGSEDSQGILGLIQSPAQKEIIERLTAFMSLVEGHAEYVMNAVGPDVVPSIGQIRERFGQRRKGTGPVDRLLRRLLGLDVKIRQYADGSKFVGAVVDAVGIEGFNQVWTSPETLPRKPELADPHAWVAARPRLPPRSLRVDPPTGRGGIPGSTFPVAAYVSARLHGARRPGPTVPVAAYVSARLQARRRPGPMLPVAGVRLCSAGRRGDVLGPRDGGSPPARSPGAGLAFGAWGRGWRRRWPAVRVAVRRLLAEVRPAGVLVACSGGADSVALAAATAFEAPRLGDPGRAGDRRPRPAGGLGGLGRRRRPSSVARLGLDPVLIRRVDVGTAGGPEAAARTARYARPRRGRRRPRRAARAHARRPGRDRAARAGPRLRAAVDRRHAPGRRALAAPAARGPPGDHPGRLRRRAPARTGTTRTTPTPASPGSGCAPRCCPLLEDALHGGVAEALARTAELLRDDLDALDGLAAALSPSSPTLPVDGLAGPAPGDPHPGAQELGRRPAHRRPVARARRPGRRLARPGPGRPALRPDGQACVWHAAPRRTGSLTATQNGERCTPTTATSTRSC